MKLCCCCCVRKSKELKRHDSSTASVSIVIVEANLIDEQQAPDPSPATRRMSHKKLWWKLFQLGSFCFKLRNRDLVTKETLRNTWTRPIKFFLKNAFFNMITYNIYHGGMKNATKNIIKIFYSNVTGKI